MLPLSKHTQPWCRISHTLSQDTVPRYIFMMPKPWVMNREPWGRSICLTLHVYCAACCTGRWCRVSPIYMFSKCMSPWKLSAQAERKCLCLVHKLSKQELVSIWCLPYFTDFICLVTFNNWGIAQNFSSGSIVLVCCCGFWYCNQHSLGTLLVLEITASVKPSVLTQILYLAQLSKILAPRGKTSQWNIRMMMRRERFSKGYHSTSNRNWILLTANLNLVKRDFPPLKKPVTGVLQRTK